MPGSVMRPCLKIGAQCMFTFNLQLDNFHSIFYASFAQLGLIFQSIFKEYEVSGYSEFLLNINGIFSKGMGDTM